MRILFSIVLTATLALAAGKSSARSSGSTVRVKPHVTKNGTYVEGHTRTRPNKTQTDNWSAKGNQNPNSGKKGTRTPAK